MQRYFVLVGLLFFIGCSEKSDIIKEEDIAKSPPLSYCGDNLCQDWEMIETHPGYCPSDCPGPANTGECGDDFCDSGENISSYPYYCPNDCS